MQLNVSQNLNTSQRQELTMAPQQIQALAILQADVQELEQRIAQEVAVNPLLEFVTPGQEVLEADLHAGDRRSPEEITEDLRAQMIEGDESLSEALQEDFSELYLDNYLGELYRRRPDAEAEERRKYFFDSAVAETSLQDYLEAQIREAVAGDQQLFALCLEVVGNLDDAGYLRSSAAEMARQLELPEEEIAKAIALLQSLEPAGLAARDLRECLLLQLERNGEKGSIAWDIVDRHLEDLARNRLPLIAKEVDADLDEVKEAQARIQQLSPKPGLALSSATAPVIIPDVYIEKNADAQWTVRMNNEIIPRVAINQEYLDKLNDPALPAADRHFLRDKQQAANQLLWAIDQRQSTLEKITILLVNFQREFLEHGDSHLRPLVMATLADTLGLHETTISRAIANKYVSTPMGVFPFKHFFTTGYSNADSGEEVSSRAVRQRIAALIQQENPRKPLSDQKISQLLQAEGLTVARRTVAKYRDEENIPAASLRRQH
ncbi:MAG: RNA polymerase factor sigma-54 [Lentisphaerae bacterium]|nr:RNA polymerase factor sigma-54 [Lentisphaerota bacterium]